MRGSYRQRQLVAVVATLVLASLVTTVPAHADGVLFTDGFESGDMSRWTVSSGVAVQQQVVSDGAWAAQATSTGNGAYAFKALSLTQSDLFYVGRFNVLSQGDNIISLVRFRTDLPGAIFTIFRRTDGRLYYWNEVTGATAFGPQIPIGSWHELEIHAVVNGASGQIGVSLDGTPIAGMTKTDNLGTTPVGRVYIGDSAPGRTFGVAFDDQVLSTSPDVSAPTTPTGLTAVGRGANQVDLSWSAATDNVGVTGYTIYRDGTVIGSVDGSTSAYSDTSAAPSTTYTYAVDAFDAGGNHSTQSNSVAVSTPAAPDVASPTVPTSLTVVDSSSNRVDLSWSASTDDVGVAGYTLYRDGAYLAEIADGSTTYADPSVAPSTTYSYTADAFDAAGNHSSQSDAATTTTPAPGDNPPPVAPTNLVATAVSGSEVDLSWTASADSDVAGYTVYRDGTSIGTVGSASTAFADRSVKPSTAYGYTVDTFDTAGSHSSQTSVASVTTPAAADDTPPSTPTGLTASAVGSDRVDLAWSASDDDVGVVGYTVFRDNEVVASVDAPMTAFSDSSLSPSTSYHYTVDAFDAAGNHSVKSSEVSATTTPPSDTIAPTAPGTPVGEMVSPTRIDLRWTLSTDNVGVAGYTVYRNGAVLANVGAGFTTFSDESVVRSTSYSYAVDAFDAAGNHSVRSGSVTVATPGLAFSSGFETGDTSEWTAATGMTVQGAIVHAGAYAAQGTSNGAPTYVYNTLSPALSDFAFDGWFDVVSQAKTTTLALVRFRTATLGPVFSLFRRNDGRLAYYNEVTKTATALAPISGGSWHHLVVHTTINGTSGGVAVTLDGANVLDKVDNIGAAPVGRVYVGDVLTGNTYDLVVDDLVVSTSADTSPPTTPTGVRATPISGTHVNVEWAAATDNVAVAGYTVYRDGSVAGTVGPLVSGFADFAAPTAQSLTYTVVAFDTSGNKSSPSASASTTTPVASAVDPSIIAVGDTACDPTSGAFQGGSGTATACHQRYTSDIAFHSTPTAILPLGDEQYEVGGFAAFQQSYDPSWGRVATIARPVPGNHEYLTAAGSGYYTYFGSSAGDPTRGWYSYDIGSWHLIALNGECSAIGGCGVGSPEEIWLQNDLAAHPNTCTLAYWHEPRWSSGWEAGSDSTYSAFWSDLYEAHADVVLNGHDHDYERFAPQNPLGVADPAGIREFVVGTGGGGLGTLGTRAPNTEVFQNSTFGVLQLTLLTNSYDWTFLNDGFGTFTDSGSGACH